MMRKGTPEQQLARDEELRLRIAIRNSAKAYSKAYREKNLERLREYDRQRYLKLKAEKLKWQN